MTLSRWRMPLAHLECVGRGPQRVENKSAKYPLQSHSLVLDRVSVSADAVDDRDENGYG